MLYRDKKNEKINGAYVYAYLCIMNDYSMCCNVSRCVCVHRRSNDPDYYGPDYSCATYHSRYAKIYKQCIEKLIIRCELSIKNIFCTSTFYHNSYENY